ncbi:hypothetical protein ALP8811_00903 [Aliiroseovarius pelagivivens]|uniref:Uncharacterized protein n=1 Tax=Aliiroseovarius pelagivivens TaxID=1639690 RepID=A0A2R8AIQ4_9RHOB|nr:hypothetical protein ALP8811_00903 [Aliiroseovarius pelagivivens]
MNGGEVSSSSRISPPKIFGLSSSSLTVLGPR